MNEKRKIPFSVRIVLLVLVACGVIGGILAYWHFHTEDPFQVAINAEFGQLDGKSQAEIEAELDKVVEDGYMNVSINSRITFTSPDAKGAFLIENSPANRYPQEVVITLADTGEEIYSSGILLPNYHITEDTLSTQLEPGEYECVATFTQYDIDSMTVMGACNVVIEIVVE